MKFLSGCKRAWEESEKKREDQGARAEKITLEELSENGKVRKITRIEAELNKPRRDLSRRKTQLAVSVAFWRDEMR